MGFINICCFVLLQRYEEYEDLYMRYGEITKELVRKMWILTLVLASYKAAMVPIVCKFTSKVQSSNQTVIMVQQPYQLPQPHFAQPLPYAHPQHVPQPQFAQPQYCNPSPAATRKPVGQEIEFGKEM